MADSVREIMETDAQKAKDATRKAVEKLKESGDVATAKTVVAPAFAGLTSKSAGPKWKVENGG